jgi:hypothetical protein
MRFPGDSSYYRRADDERQPAISAPFDRDLELAVIHEEGTVVLIFPCRRIPNGWMDAETKERLPDLEPTHWREWPES